MFCPLNKFSLFKDATVIRLPRTKHVLWRQWPFGSLRTCYIHTPEDEFTLWSRRGQIKGLARYPTPSVITGERLAFYSFKRCRTPKDEFTLWSRRGQNKGHSLCLALASKQRNGEIYQHLHIHWASTLSDRELKWKLREERMWGNTPTKKAQFTCHKRDVFAGKFGDWEDARRMQGISPRRNPKKTHYRGTLLLDSSNPKP